MFPSDPLWNLLGTAFLVVMVGYLLFTLVKSGRRGFGRRAESAFLVNTGTRLRNFLAYYFANAFRFLDNLWGIEEQIEERKQRRSNEAREAASQ